MQSEQNKVVAVDRMSDGLVILFNNGRAALYSSELLYTMLNSAVPLSSMQENQPSSEVSGVADV